MSMLEMVGMTSKSLYMILDDHECVYPRGNVWCPEGWKDIVERLIVDLIVLGWNREVHQIKDKFGGLRFYVDKDSAGIIERIYAAENESMRTCEECGKPGQRVYLGNGAYIATRCEEHGQKIGL